LKNKILILGNPDSIHTKKWIEGWKLIGYHSMVSGVSDNIDNRVFVIKGDISSAGSNGLKYLKNIFKFRTILKKVDPIIVNPHYLTSYGFVGALIKRKKDFMVMSIHGTDIMVTMDKNFVYLMMAKYVFFKSDIIVSVSNVMTNKIVQYFPYLKNKIITQQYGVKIDYLNQFLNAKKDIFITTNRQWKPNSNYPIILDALENFKDENMRIIGSYKDDYSNDIMMSHKDLEKYSTGLISHEKNIEFVARSLIFISLTTSDGIPLSVVEAMYLGAIPIVSDIEPNRELINDGINGFLVPIDSDALKNKIDEVAKLDENEILKIQEYNKRLILEKFDFDKNFRNLNKVLEKRLNKYE